MLTFLFCADGKLHQTLDDDDVVMFACIADFNHTDIILLFDDEVLTLIQDALYTNDIPEWLELKEFDEWIKQL